MARVTKTLKRDTFVFLGIIAFLTILGFIFIYSSSSVYAFEKFHSASYFLKKQAFFLLPSLGGLVFFSWVPVSFWRRYASLFFFLSLMCTVLVFMPGFTNRIHGSSRWLSFGGVGFQPSELLKLFLFIYLGFFLEKKRSLLQPHVFSSYLQISVLLGLSFLLLLKQPDFGSVVTIFCTSLLLFFVAEFDVRHLMITFAVTIPVGALLIYLKSYRLARVMVFLDPWVDPLGKGFQIIQSLVAIGAGGVWGLGIAQSKQKFFYLPMQHTDFIFPIIAEETGFVGSSLVILCFMLFCYFGIRIVRQLSDEFAFFVALSFIILISLQAAINLMMTCGLLPTKGLGLPFISYGGTALLTFFCMVGFIVSAVRHERRKVL